MSPIDKMFHEVYGTLPTKAGTAYEMFACIAEHLMIGGEVQHDDRLRGEFSKTLYQIDVHSISDEHIVMGEAKDYTIRNGKVGRGDLQKLGGALLDLPNVTKGKFYSATGYTAPAKKYANSAKNFSEQKSIEIYELRPSTEADEDGTIKTVVIEIIITTPRADIGSWKPHFTETGKRAIKATLEPGQSGINYNLTLEKFYHETGKPAFTMYELTKSGYAEANWHTKSAHATFLLKNTFILINGTLAEMRGLEYEIPFEETRKTITITDDRQCRFILKDQNGEILRFITDDQLKNYSFDNSGRLIINNQ